MCPQISQWKSTLGFATEVSRRLGLLNVTDSVDANPIETIWFGAGSFFPPHAIMELPVKGKLVLGQALRE